MKNLSVAVVDYDCGNLHSASKALELAMKESDLSGSVFLTKDPEKIINSYKLILPGVGAFKACIEKLKSIDGLQDSIEEFALKKQKPILGICIGLQLMASKSYEGGEQNGLSLIHGDVVPIFLSKNDLKIPHMGWNNMLQEKEHSVLNGLNNKDFYFVHSYRFKPKNNESILANTNYGEDFPSVLCSGNIIGTQFHPEKSQGAGIALLKNFLEWAP